MRAPSTPLACAAVPGFPLLPCLLLCFLPLSLPGSYLLWPTLSLSEETELGLVVLPWRNSVFVLYEGMCAVWHVPPFGGP